MYKLTVKVSKEDTERILFFDSNFNSGKNFLQNPWRLTPVLKSEINKLYTKYVATLQVGLFDNDIATIESNQERKHRKRGRGSELDMYWTKSYVLCWLINLPKFASEDFLFGILTNKYAYRKLVRAVYVKSARKVK